MAGVEALSILLLVGAACLLPLDAAHAAPELLDRVVAVVDDHVALAALHDLNAPLAPPRCRV